MSNKKNRDWTQSRIGELSIQCLEDSEKWFGDTGTIKSVPYMTLAMAGEVGEFANIVKKIQRGSLDMHDSRVRLDLAMELTDAFVYMLNIAGLLGIDLEKTYDMVRMNNEKRFMEERKKREMKAND